MTRFVTILLMLVALAPSPARAADEPRIVVILHDGAYATASAAIAEEPLAHLGLLTEPHDAAGPLPPLAGRRDVRGVVIWLDQGAIAGDATFIAWVREATRGGLPVVLMGATPQVEDRFALFLTLGLLYSRDDRAYTYDLRPIDKDIDIADFERPYDNVFRPTPIVRPLDAALSHPILTLQRRADVIDRTNPVIITPKGAYAADGYALWRDASGKAHRWYIDPVRFFRLALRMQRVPAPDRTTMWARRIYAAMIMPAGGDAGDWFFRAIDEAASAQGQRLAALPLAVQSDPLEAAPLTYPIPSDPTGCDSPMRALLMGYDGAAAAIADATTSRRSTPFAPLFRICRPAARFFPIALNSLLDAASETPLAPITPGTLIDIDASFIGVRLERRGPLAWRVFDRGAIQTLRFDDAEELHIDWTHSAGVLGAARLDDALYVSLDPAVTDPTVAVTDAPWESPPFPALVESRWSIAALDRDPARAAMDVQGYGPGDMAWSVAPNSSWEIRLTPRDAMAYRFRGVATPEGLLSFSLPALATDGATMEMVRRDVAERAP